MTRLRIRGRNGDNNVLPLQVTVSDRLSASVNRFGNIDEPTNHGKGTIYKRLLITVHYVSKNVKYW